MTNPYSVPIEDLDAVHVEGEALVEERGLADVRWAAGALLLPAPFAAGTTGDAD